MRIIAWILGLFVFVLAVAVGTAIFMYPRLPHYLSSYLSEKFKVPVHINSIDLKADDILIKGIDIANPKPATLPTALKVRKTEIKVPLIRYFKQDIVIDEIQLDDIYASVEFFDKGNKNGNWTVLIANFDSNQSFGTSQGRKKSKPSSGKSVLIKKMIMTNIVIDLKLYGKSVNRLSPIPRLEFDNVGTEQGFPVEEVTEIIVQKLMQQIFSLHGLGNMFQSIIEAPEKAASGILRGIFGGN